MVLADDDVLLREGVASLLTGAGYEVVGQAGDPDAEFVVESVEGHELLWYATQEIPALLAEQGRTRDEGETP